MFSPQEEHDTAFVCGYCRENGSYQEEGLRKCESRLSAFQFNSSPVLAKPRKDEVVKPPPHDWMPQLRPVTPRRPHPSWPATKSLQLLLSSFPRLSFACDSAVGTSDANRNHAQLGIKRAHPKWNTWSASGGGKAGRKGLLRAAHWLSHTTHWTAAFLRAISKYFVPSRSQKVTLAGKTQERPSPFSEDLPLCLLGRALVVKICNWDQLIVPRETPGWRHFQHGFPPRQLWHAASFTRNVAKRHLWRCQCHLTAHRGNLLWRACTLLWLQEDETRWQEDYEDAARAFCRSK